MYKIKYVKNVVSQLYIQASDSLETKNDGQILITCSSFPPLRYVVYVSLGVIPQCFGAGWQKLSGLWQDGEKGIQEKKLKQSIITTHLSRCFLKTIGNVVIRHTQSGYMIKGFNLV